MELTTIIMSRGRPKTITSHRMFPHALVVVPDDEIGAYAKTVDRQLLSVIPAEIRGISAVRNWIVRKFADRECLVICDDDIIEVRSVVQQRSIRLPPECAERIIENGAVMASEAGVGAFSFNRTHDPRKFLPNYPFNLNGSMEAIVGILDKRVLWDETLKARADIDWSLQHLLVNRIVWIDQRYAFVHGRNKNVGGNSALRTKSQVDQDKNAVKRKWGEYVNFSTRKGTDRVSVSVPRRQNLL